MGYDDDTPYTKLNNSQQVLHPDLSQHHLPYSLTSYICSILYSTHTYTCNILLIPNAYHCKTFYLFDT